MVGILSFGSFSNKLLFPIFCGLFSSLLTGEKRLRDYYDSEKKKKGLSIFGQHNFFYYWLMSLAESCAIFPYLLQQFYTRRMYKIKHKTNYLQITKQILYYALCFFIDFIVSVFDNILTGPEYIVNIFKLLSIVILAGVCMLILGYKYYKHHAVGLGVIAIGLIALTLVSTFARTEDDIKVWLDFILNFVFKFLAALLDVLVKYALEKLYYDPYMFLFGQGMIGVFSLGIMALFLKNITCTKTFDWICDEL